MSKINKIADIHLDQHIIKPWGEEIIFTPNNLNYTFKMLTIKKNCRISLQSHTEKIETFVLVEGEANLIIGSDIDHLEVIKMTPKRGYTIDINTIHRMEAISEGVVILEGSTPETGVTVRYQDDYNRPNETEAMRKEKNRGWKVTIEQNDRTKE